MLLRRSELRDEQFQLGGTTVGVLAVSIGFNAIAILGLNAYSPGTCQGGLLIIGAGLGLDEPRIPGADRRRKEDLMTSTRPSPVTAATSEIDREEGQRMYRMMHLIRAVELAIQKLFLRGEVHGTTHLYVGQEAVATGVCSALRRDDYVAGTYRGHGHSLAKGVPANALLAEMLGRVDGVCAGRSGSMNVTAIDHGLLGCYGIIGGSIAAATGGALSGKMQGRVAVSFFGDGSTNQAYFFECLNFAKVHRLPLVCICENNLYGEYTPMEQVTAGPGIVARGEVFGITSERIDGNDVFAVKAAAQAAVDRARREHEPALLECMTYRQVGHSRSDPATYRPDGELEAWLKRDPLPAARDRLVAAGVDEETLTEVEASAAQEVEDAVEFALASPFPEPTIAKEYCDAGA